MGDPHSYLRALLDRPGSVHLAVQDSSDRIVAVGHLMPDNEKAEAALLVEDAWQNNGLGTRLLRHLGHHAIRGGWKEMYGLILPGDERISAVLRHAAVPVHFLREDGATTAWAETSDIAIAVPPWRRRTGCRSSARDW
ncbi:GNAT family N-acetyltransferase [Streptomyces sp. NBC_00316]|uniref:GNAT family N-acetyltransferase n=1 Tax=Streptomyces sp. NBC_00316 TaxID=2975710 RepID=UPI002E287EF5|nr:GNAT family N-acetyltransferase [Streptomyces sp. NBC_00316]